MFSQLKLMYPLDVFTAIIDIAVVSYLLYKFLVLIRGTRAVQLIKGIAVVILATFLSQWLHLYTINWLLQKIQVMLFVALPVVFQPELRRALEQLGRGGFFTKLNLVLGEEDLSQLINEIVRAVEVLSRNKTGALIVLERETGLRDIIETGVRMEALVSAELLINIFVPNTPLHDGALILRGNRIMAAACFLPLTERPDIGPELGSRHRAGLGISENSDALAIVVSEETGTVSMAQGGKLIRYLDSNGLKDMLVSLYQRKFLHISNWQTRG